MGDPTDLEEVPYQESDQETHRGAFGEFAGESTGLIDRAFRERIVLAGVTLGRSDPEATDASMDELARLVETAGTRDLFRAPEHPYTAGLLASVPQMHSMVSQSLRSISGQPPDLANLPPGCPFAPRCTFVRDVCHTTFPDEVEVGAGDNETFTFTVKEVAVIDFDAGQSDDYEVEGRLASLGSVPAPVPDADTDNEGMLVIPHIVGLDLSLEDPSGASNAGTATELTAVVTNNGNAPDSVRVATVDDTCPLLEVSGEQTLLGVSIARGGTHTVNLTASASPSHPTKTCRIELSIQSQGDWNVGTFPDWGKVHVV